MANDVEILAMRVASELARRGLGATSPNPIVGALVLDSTGQVQVGSGWHQRAGGPHAEVVALEAAGTRARGGTLVVTLEPCAHQGRTPPCVEAVLTAGVSRVVVGVPDPTDVGGGAARLRAAGVDVEVGVEAADCARDNEAWLLAVQRQRPFVVLKQATSLDGRVAAADGSSQWITGTDARLDGHRLRGESDAVLVGSATVLADDPHLTARDADGQRVGTQPVRVVLDTGLRTPPDARVFDDAAPTLLFTASTDAGRHGAYADAKVDVVSVPFARHGGVDLEAVLAELYARDVRQVLVEGGAQVAGSFVDARLVDRVVAYVAPLLLGGEGPLALGGLGAATIDAGWRLRLDDVTQVGADVRLTARPAEVA